MDRRKLLATDLSSRSCIFGPNMQQNLTGYFWFDNTTAYLVFITFQFAFATLVINLYGNRLMMVFLIVLIVLVQNFSTVILESVFLCSTEPHGTTFGGGYFFWYSLIQQLANMQIYVTLIWTYNWINAWLNLKMEFALNALAD